MAQNQLKNSSSNKFAKELKDRKYHQRVVINKKAYDRKKLKQQDMNGLSKRKYFTHIL